MILHVSKLTWTGARRSTPKSTPKAIADLVEALPLNRKALCDLVMEKARTIPQRWHAPQRESPPDRIPEPLARKQPQSPNISKNGYQPKYKESAAKKRKRRKIFGTPLFASLRLLGRA
jgi:hypothetical protein